MAVSGLTAAYGRTQAMAVCEARQRWSLTSSPMAAGAPGGGPRRTAVLRRRRSLCDTRSAA
eukprot:3953237-Pyramimonas_sp.AAC.1